MIMIKHVVKNAVSQSDQKIIMTEINVQNFKIHDVMNIEDTAHQTQQEKHMKQHQSRHSNYRCGNSSTDEYSHSERS